MQKKIIALAVAGLMSGAAFAQSNVQIYGRLDVGYLNSDNNTTSAAGVKGGVDMSTTGFSTGALTTSRIGFKGSEDLGGGLKANFNLEYGLAATHKVGADVGADLAAPFTTRQAWVGLSSANWGEVAFGRQSAVIETQWGMGSAGAQNNAVGSLYGDTRLTDPRVDEAITYISPMFSGFQAKVQYGKGDSDVKGMFGTDKHTRWGASLAYANGPVNAGFGYSHESQDNDNAVAGAQTSNDLSQWVATGSYDFGIAKVFGLYTRGHSEGGYANANLSIAAVDGEINRRSGWELGVNVPLGRVILIGSYYRAKTDFDNLAAATDADHDGYQLAALYPLSKRTIAYAAYGSTDTDHSNSVRKSETDQFTVGLRQKYKKI